jgi:F-type H+-transporting ATPase subunit b
MRIDYWTLALQTVNVLILIWLLARFFFRPIAKVVATRQQAADALLAEAARVRQKASDARAAADEARADIAAQRDALLAQARDAAQAEKQKLLAQTADEIAKLREQATTAIARDSAAAETAIIERAGELSVEIARRLLARFPQQDVFDGFVDDIGRALRALPADARAGLASAAAAGRPLEIVTAAPLSAEDSARVGAALNDALGADLPVVFRSDPALLAGIELNGQNTMIRNSWRADLDRIRLELNNGKHARQS